jgi:MerR family transcriptional regulator, copper efflux regulator
MRERQGHVFQIGELASRVTLSLRTVRFYEEAGLVLPARRSPGGFRLYTEDAVDRLLLIKQMKPLGFTLDEMRLLIEAREVLHSDDADPALQHEMRERLEMFSAAAAERCLQLDEQLNVAKAFARTLDEEVGRRLPKE